MKNTIFVMALLALSIQGIGQAMTVEVPKSVAPYTHVESLSQSGTAPAETDLWTPMVPPVNALVMSMAEQGSSYDLENDYFVWNSLYYMIGLYGTQDWRVHEELNHYIIPMEMVEDYAFALFGYSDHLPEIPEMLQSFVEFDSESQVYHWQKGDASLTDSRLVDMIPLGDGTFEIHGEFFAEDHDLVLWYFSGVIQENDSMFGYSIVDFSIDPVIFVN